MDPSAAPSPYPYAQPGAYPPYPYPYPPQASAAWPAGYDPAMMPYPDPRLYPGGVPGYPLPGMPHADYYAAAAVSDFQDGPRVPLAVHSVQSTKFNVHSSSPFAAAQTNLLTCSRSYSQAQSFSPPCRLHSTACFALHKQFSSQLSKCIRSSAPAWPADAGSMQLAVTVPSLTMPVL